MFTSRQPIRWGDMDSLGHVNNTVYFRYLEQARIEWLFALTPERSAFEGTGPVIVNASCTFLVPLVYPGEIAVCDIAELVAASMRPGDAGAAGRTAASASPPEGTR